MIFKLKSKELTEKYRNKYVWITGEEMGAVEYDNLEEDLDR